MKRIAFVLALLAFGSVAESGSPSREEDEAIVREYLKQYTYVMTKPVYVYHWFKLNDPENWEGSRSASSSAGLEYFQNAANVYWSEISKGRQRNNFGLGLY